jgi:hypothetical protein
MIDEGVWKIDSGKMEVGHYKVQQHWSCTHAFSELNELNPVGVTFG